ncbi:hypothetical protein DB35_24705 [Streptomyces abyssalis]|uniref:Peptidase S11 D-alanyl-D-alanine carboxypeptidase A N-terminal domain-containing protein n=1 Tax=Streptomyces abyssalis TaxID=933944 RepID=A0A1E7JNF0_9ACTN|nr:D-alanyl-D-alanine carboxypeptidase [Streptomyces abyssalis]OEU86818.1 hypothetical protein DB35_24705 [Streptomyces abyssalis]OEU89798.1 hypothetical protein AN215_08860 [Streptomyces abyssalis]
MAGESPDKVERGQSSGETTDDGAAVASTGGKKAGAEKSGGKKSGGGKRERKTGARPDAARTGSKKNPGEARNEAPGDASTEAPADSARSGDESEAEAPGTATRDAAADPGSPDASDAPDDSGPAGAADPGSAAEGKGRSDDRLKAAVAAWVAGSDDEPDEAAPDAASADGPGGRVDDEGGGDGGDGGDGGAVKDGAAKSGAGEKVSSQIPASHLPVRPKSEEDEEPDPADDPRAPEASEGSEASDGAESSAEAVAEADHPTAMFRTVRPGSDDSAAAIDSEEAARRAERMTSAFFGSGKSAATEEAAAKTEKADKAADEAEDSARSAGKEDRSGAHGESRDGRRDEERGEDPGEREPAAGEAEPGQGRETAGDPDGSGEPDGQAGQDTERIDEPTAAFRTVRADDSATGKTGKKSPPEKSGNGRVDQPTTAFRTVEPGKGSEARGKEDAEAKPAKPVDPRVAGFVKPRTDGGDEAGSGTGPKSAESTSTDSKSTDSKSTESEPTSKSPAAEPESKPKPGTESRTDTKPEPKPESESRTEAKPESESESERTSQFVPLRSADAPPSAKRTPSAPVVPPKPEGKPTAGELPPEAESPKLTEAELTRQQVRPDQAPLDLLAQLTNTPPPPETPLRTAVRRVKIWTPLVVVLVVLFAIAQAVRPLPEPELSLSAQPTYSFQGPKPSVPWPSEGQAALDVQGLGSFGTSGKQKPVPIASVAKVMTAYVILRDHPVKKGSKGAKIPVDQKAEDEAGLSAQNESTVEVKKGDTLSEREAVQAVMIASANNVARLLARWDAGSEKAFAKKMNAAAEDLGMKNTKYTDPSGLTSSTVSTASDQVKLAKKAMGIDLFRETVRLPGYKDAKGEQHGNWNKLVPLDGVVGIKTGTTTKAGGNLLFAAEKKVGGTEQLIIGAVLGQYEPSILDTVLRESKKLIDTAQDSLRAQKVVQKGEVVGYVDDQLGGRTPVVASRDVSAVGWSGLKVKLGLTDGGDALPHEGKAGDRAGTLTVGDGPGQVRVPVTLKEDMSEPGFGAKLTRIL